MKSLKLKKVKISRIGNPHILFGGGSVDTCNCPPKTRDADCLYTKDVENPKCGPTVTNTGTLRTVGDPAPGNGLDTGNTYSG